tara:strand:- start:302 stop:487 length:186 start_codon:yes stop_codon:yes gene_type:complete
MRDEICNLKPCDNAEVSAPLLRNMPAISLPSPPKLWKKRMDIAAGPIMMTKVGGGAGHSKL